MDFQSPAHLPSTPRLQPLTLCVLTSSPTVMYTMGLATATMSAYSFIAKRSSGSGTLQARQMNLLSPQGQHVKVGWVSTPTRSVPTALCSGPLQWLFKPTLIPVSVPTPLSRLSSPQRPLKPLPPIVFFPLYWGVLPTISPLTILFTPCLSSSWIPERGSRT